jgi:hypothetical protein
VALPVGTGGVVARRGAVVVVVDGARRGAIVVGGATVVTGAGTVTGTVTATVVVVESSGVTEATTRLGSVELAVWVAPLLGERWNMSITSNGKHASVTTSAIISRRCVGCTVVFRTASFVEQ